MHNINFITVRKLRYVAQDPKKMILLPHFTKSLNRDNVLTCI